MNAVKHGGYMQHADSITATLLGKDPNDIDQFYEALLADLGPETALDLCQAAAIAQPLISTPASERTPHVPLRSSPVVGGAPSTKGQRMNVILRIEVPSVIIDQSQPADRVD